MAHIRGNSNKQRQNPRMAPLVVGLSLVVVLFVGILLAVHFLGERSEPVANAGTAIMPDAKGKQMTLYNGRWYTKKEGLVTTLVLGVDKNADFQQDISAGTSEQADLLLLMVADPKNESYSVVHINRDTMTDIMLIGTKGTKVGTYVAQLALSYNYGLTKRANCENTVDAVSNLLRGIEIDHYLSLSMDGMIVLNDAIGGVTLEVMDDFTGIDDTLAEGETVTLMGEHALLYVRERKRMEDNTNLHRMVRQEQYLTAFQEQFRRQAQADSSFVTSTLLQVNEYMVSDCTINQLSDMLNGMSEYEMSEARTLEGEAVAGVRYIEFYPDKAALRQLVMELFYDPA